MTILVTGGSGFIGSHVVDKLVEKGKKVIVFDIKEPHRKDVDFVNGNILSLEDLKKVMKDTEYIYHIAAFSNVDLVTANPLKTINYNILGTANVLEAARLNNIKRVLFASSVYVYEKKGHLYTTAKQASELICKDYETLYGLPYTILRYATVYGPRSRGADVVSLFVKKALNGKEITIHGDGSQYRNFIYVEDLAEGNVAALSKKAKNQTYNLEGLRPVTIKEVAETIRKFVGNVKIEYDKKRIEDYKGKIISNKKTEKELGWKSKVDFREGIKRYIEWYKKTFSD